MKKSVEYYMALEWEPVFTARPEGDYSLTVPPLDDFEMFGSPEELQATWRDALRVHLTGYLAVEKWIPRPLTMRVAEAPEIEGGSSGWEKIEGERLSSSMPGLSVIADTASS